MTWCVSSPWGRVCSAGTGMVGFWGHGQEILMVAGKGNDLILSTPSSPPRFLPSRWSHIQDASPQLLQALWGGLHCHRLEESRWALSGLLKKIERDREHPRKRELSERY
jgi:hypothetical protein